MPSNYRKIFVDMTEEELLRMTREEACMELTDKQRRFCEVFVGNHNALLACKKAGYSPKASQSISWKMRQNEDVNRYLAWLKLRIGIEHHIKATDIIDHYARIAFADINDFVTIENNRLKLVNSDMIDGQLVKSVKQGRDGITVELIDKLQALQKLERYFDVMPKDWKQKIEEKKIHILEQRLEFEKLKAGQLTSDTEDDGFLEALKQTATEVWGDDDEQ